MPSNAIVGCASTQLSSNEIDLFADMQPWGLILFSRNLDNPTQVISLIEQAKKAMGRSELIVLIDQEGGRVSRLPQSHWRVPPAPTLFASMFSGNPDIAKRACFLNALLTGLELKPLGINVNCAPMLDVPQASAASIISERALGDTPQQVIDLARQIITGLKRAGVAPVIKHMPGHGRALCDSHLSLPVVDAAIKELGEHDFLPFLELNNEAMAMTAHVVFNRIDERQAATTSETIIKTVMRGAIGFNGLIMTDDINMQALSGSIASRAKRSLKAGCDVVLHCSGVLEEMQELQTVLRPLTDESLLRAKQAEQIAFAPMPDTSAKMIEEELKSLLADYS